MRGSSGGRPVRVRIAAWPGGRGAKDVERLLRRAATESAVEKTAAKILDDVRRRGDAALLEYERRFDGCTLSRRSLRVGPRELKAARAGVERSFRRAARQAHANVLRFARSGRRGDWRLATDGGGWLEEKFVPLERVGVYVPGGAAPLASTVLMTVTLAAAAGVPEIVVCTPPDRNGGIDAHLLYCLELAGATEVYRLGGIQAIGAMAYGTETVKAVRKIVGPGGPFVTAAKRLVYGTVALDSVAGPSEIAVLADGSARADWVAADLLSQAEHGTGHEKLLFVTDSRSLAEEVSRELVKQAVDLDRGAAVERVLRLGTVLAVVADLDAGVELCNRFAPEHLELMVRRPRRLLKKVRSAGAVFLGRWTPESVGDFVAGPSHVLPTGGTAAMFSGLTVEDFRRRLSVIEYRREDLKRGLGVIEEFARVEGLPGHGRSARIRFARGKGR